MAGLASKCSLRETLFLDAFDSTNFVCQSRSVCSALGFLGPDSVKILPRLLTQHLLSLHSTRVQSSAAGISRRGCSLPILHSSALWAVDRSISILLVSIFLELLPLSPRVTSAENGWMAAHSQICCGAYFLFSGFSVYFHGDTREDFFRVFSLSSSHIAPYLIHDPCHSRTYLLLPHRLYSLANLSSSPQGSTTREVGMGWRSGVLHLQGGFPPSSPFLFDSGTAGGRPASGRTAASCWKRCRAAKMAPIWSSAPVLKNFLHKFLDAFSAKCQKKLT